MLVDFVKLAVSQHERVAIKRQQRIFSLFGTDIPAKSYYLTSMNAVMGDSKMVDTFIFNVLSPFKLAEG